ncbi:MAG: low molecular weight protein-tyrosine-phosphatase [Bacilli bacterium]
MINVLFICHGNICRSPMGEYILKDMVEKLSLCDYFLIESRATSTEEIYRGLGNPIYPPAQRELRKHGIGKTKYTDFSCKRAQVLSKEDYFNFDYLLCADSFNVRNAMQIVGGDPDKKIHLILDYSSKKDSSISDPWYSGDFSATYDDLVLGCKGFLEFLINQHLL